MDEKTENVKVVEKTKLRDRFSFKKPKIKKPSKDFWKGFAVGGASGIVGGIVIDSKLQLGGRCHDLIDAENYEIDDPEIDDPTVEE